MAHQQSDGEFALEAASGRQWQSHCGVLCTLPQQSVGRAAEGRPQHVDNTAPADSVHQLHVLYQGVQHSQRQRRVFTSQPVYWRRRYVDGIFIFAYVRFNGHFSSEPGTLPLR